MSSNSTYKPRSFSLGCRIRYDVDGLFEASGEGFLFGTRALGDGTYTLVIERDGGAGKIDVHESWCQQLPQSDVRPALPEALEVEESVIDEIRKRREAGRKKYSTTMERDDLSVGQWIQHAKEEALDFAIYLEKLKREIDERDDYLALRGNETLATFGGEYWSDDVEFSEYGFDLSAVSVHGITPKQAVGFACTLVDHLIRNGHDFELREGTHQDQRLALVCTDQK